MPFTLTMPKLSPTMEEGAIAKWHKKVGDHVEAGDVLIDVSTDKATVEHSALDGGWLRKILIPEGEAAIVNQPIAIFTEEKNESIEGYKPTGVSPEKPEVKPEEEAPRKEKAAAQATTPAPAKGVALSQPAFVPEPPLEEYEFTSPTEMAEERIRATPLARKLAKEKGLDLSTVKGTGPHQRIVSNDLQLAQPSGAIVFGKREAPKITPGTYEEEKLSPMRKVIAQRLQEAKSFIPHIYVQQTINVRALISLREQLANFEVKVSYNDLIVRACALALREHPVINSGFNSVNQTIIRFKTIDIAVAVNVKEGLVTPIVRHADYKNVMELSLEIRNLAKRAKEGKLELHEYKGGSFTISNMGMYGVTSFQAIINPPQAAILAVSGIQEVPIVKNGAIEVGNVMNLTLSADHRVIDGAVGASFMQTLKKYLENPAVLLS